MRRYIGPILLASSTQAFVPPPTLSSALPQKRQRHQQQPSSLLSAGSEDWQEFSIAPGHYLDPNYMTVVGQDYSSQHDVDCVVQTAKPGMRFGKTLIERAEVIVSRGPEPLGEGEEPPPIFDLQEGEYIVNRGTKVNKNRMYVMYFEPSATREGGTVLRTINPGVRDEYGGTIQLAEVVASSGPDGKWREPKAGEGTDEEDGGGADSRSRGMVAFSSTVGIGRQEHESGYTYGPGRTG